MHIIQKRDLLEMLKPFRDDEKVVVSVENKSGEEIRKLIKRAELFDCGEDTIEEMQSIIDGLAAIELEEGVGIINKAERGQIKGRPAIEIEVLF